MGVRVDNATALYLEAIRDGNYIDAINAYAGERYTQHSTPVKDGKVGFIEFFADFAERNPVRDIEIVRAFEDGQYVFLHVLQDLNHGEFQYVTADIFDTDDDGKLIEHWDIIAEVQPVTASGRTQLDGPTVASGAEDLAKTEENKQLVARFIDEVLIPADYSDLSQFMAVDLAQHNPDMADGVDAFRTSATDASLRYIELHNVIGSGNFVASLAEAETRAAGSPATRQAVIDLFRIENDKIVEHWDVMETITPRETWVNSGKF
jgi:predicted SnoaL-like aldol condensation-catalyzing enzyme